MSEPSRPELSVRTEKRRRFLIDFIYTGFWIVLLLLIVYCTVKWALPFVFAFAVAALFQRPIRWLVKKTGVKRQFFSVVLLILMVLLLAGLILFLGWRRSLPIPRLWRRYLVICGQGWWLGFGESSRQSIRFSAIRPQYRACWKTVC